MSRTLGETKPRQGHYSEGTYSFRFLEITGLTPADTPGANRSADRLQFKVMFEGGKYDGKKLVFWRSLTDKGEELIIEILKTANLGTDFEIPDEGDHSLEAWLGATQPLIGMTLVGVVRTAPDLDDQLRNDVYFNPPRNGSVVAVEPESAGAY